MANTTDKRTVEIVMDGRQASTTISSIGKDIGILRKSINQMQIGSKEFDVQAKKLQQLRKEYAIAQQQVRLTGKTFEYLKTQMKAVAVGTIGGNLILAAGAAVQRYFSSAVDYMATASDQLADIRRVTGLTATEVDNLSNGLSKIQTRTATKDLRDIAIVAGKLGVAKDDIIGFVQATDMLSVALGDELGNVEAITDSLGKIINAYEGAGNITEENLLKIGNAVVDLANKGVATGGYLVDFSQRLAGVAGVANLSLSDVLGLGAGFEELGQKTEVSATAITNILTKVAANVGKFAKYAGKSAEEFGQMINDKPLEAILQLSEGLQKNKDGFADIAEAFADSEIGANRVVAVMGVLGQNTDFFRQKMEETGVAIGNTNLIQDAFALKNENVAAKLAKLKKQFVAIFQSDAVQNFLKKGIDGADKFVNAIIAVSKWLRDNIYVLKAFAVTFITYLVAINRGIIAQKAEKIASVLRVLTGEITLATIKQRILNTTMLKNPYAAVAAAITGATVALAGYIKKQQEARYEAERAKLKANFDVMYGNEADKGVSDNIKNIIGNVETKSVSQLQDAIAILKQNSNAYLDAVKDTESKIGQAKLNLQEAIDKKDDLYNLSSKTFQDIKTSETKVELLNGVKKKNEKYYKEHANAINEVEQAILQKKQEHSQKMAEEEEKQTQKQKEEQDKRLQLLKDYNDKLAQLLEDAKQAKIDQIDDETTREGLQLQFNKEKQLQDAEQNYKDLIAIAKVLGKDTAEITEAYEQIKLGIVANYERKIADLLIASDEQKKKEAYNNDLAEIERNKQAELLLYKELYAEQKITKEQYDHHIEEIDFESKLKLLEIAEKYGEDAVQIEQDIADYKIKINEDLTKRLQEQLLIQAQVRVKAAELAVQQAEQKGIGIKKANLELAEAESEDLLAQLAEKENMTELTEENILLLKTKYKEEFDQIDQEFAEKEMERRKGIASFTIDTFSQMFAMISQFRADNIAQEIADLQNQKTAELQALEDKRDKRLIYEDQYNLQKSQLERKYAEQEKQLKRKQAQQEKRAAIFQIGLETAKNITEAFPNVILMAAAGILGATQIGLAAAKPIPYAKGGLLLNGPLHTQGGMPLIDPRTKQIVAELEGGEPILSRATYANNKAIVDALLHSSTQLGGKNIMPEIYSNTTAPKMNYGGIINYYYTTTYAKGGILPKTANTISVGNNNSNNDSVEMLALFKMQYDLLQKMAQKQDQPSLAIFDYDYYEESQRRINNAKNIGNVNN